MENKILIANILRFTSRYLLLIIGILVFVFALLSGAEDMSFKSILRNSPNALPWLTLIIIIFVAWKWELIGGILITLLGLFMIWFFNTGNNFYLVTFILNLLITLLGLSLIISWWLRKTNKKTNT